MFDNDIVLDYSYCMNVSILFVLNSLVGFSYVTDLLIIFFGKYLAYLVPAVLFFGLFFVAWDNRARYVRIIFLSIIAAFVAVAFSNIIKYFYPMVRPYAAFGDAIHTLFLPNDAGSFPSSHATFFSALAAAFYFLRERKIAYFLCIAAFLIAVSRVIDGIHYPLDIFSGFLVGGVIAWFVIHVFLVPFHPRTNKAEKEALK